MNNFKQIGLASKFGWRESVLARQHALQCLGGNDMADAKREFQVPYVSTAVPRVSRAGAACATVNLLPALVDSRAAILGELAVIFQPGDLQVPDSAHSHTLGSCTSDLGLPVPRPCQHADAHEDASDPDTRMCTSIAHDSPQHDSVWSDSKLFRPQETV